MLKMIILDTCAIIFDALDPKRLSKPAKHHIEQSDKDNELYCCDISFLEIAMLIQKKRIDPKIDTVSFLQLILRARRLQILTITPKIAAIATNQELIQNNCDPVDRTIAATAISHKFKLVTCDKKLRKLSELVTIW